MEELLVPTDSLTVEVHTDRRERLTGTLFAAPLAIRDSVSELATLLCDDRRYLPLRIDVPGGEPCDTLVCKAHMTYVRLVIDDGEPAATTDEAGPRCHVFLADGESIAGTLDVPVPDSHARVVDRLNRADRFVPMTTSTGPIFINRTMMVQVV